MADTVRAVQPSAEEKGRAEPGAVGVAAPVALRSGGVTWGDLFRALLDDKVVLVAVCFIILVIGSAVFADFVSPHDPYAQSIRTRMKPPMTPASQRTSATSCTSSTRRAASRGASSCLPVTSPGASAGYRTGSSATSRSNPGSSSCG